MKLSQKEIMSFLHNEIFEKCQSISNQEIDCLCDYYFKDMKQKDIIGEQDEFLDYEINRIQMDEYIDNQIKDIREEINNIDNLNIIDEERD